MDLISGSYVHIVNIDLIFNAERILQSLLTLYTISVIIK